MKYYGNHDITPLEILNTMTEKEMRKEYSRLRKVANRRLKTLSNSEIGKRSNTWKFYMNEFPSGRGKSSAEIAHRLSSAYYFLSLKSSSVTGLREMRNDFIESMHDQGYTWINKENYFDFIDFMETVKSYYDVVTYDSDRAVDVFDVMTEAGFSADDLKNDFDWWFENYRKIKSKPIKNGMSYEEYKKYVEGKNG